MSALSRCACVCACQRASVQVRREHRAAAEAVDASIDNLCKARARASAFMHVHARTQTCATLAALVSPEVLEDRFRIFFFGLNQTSAPRSHAATPRRPALPPPLAAAAAPGPPGRARPRRRRRRNRKSRTTTCVPTATKRRGPASSGARFFSAPENILRLRMAAPIFRRKRPLSAVELWTVRGAGERRGRRPARTGEAMRGGAGRVSGPGPPLTPSQWRRGISMYNGGLPQQ